MFQSQSRSSGMIVRQMHHVRPDVKYFGSVRWCRHIDHDVGDSRSYVWHIVDNILGYRYLQHIEYHHILLAWLTKSARYSYVDLRVQNVHTNRRAHRLANPHDPLFVVTSVTLLPRFCNPR